MSWPARTGEYRVIYRSFGRPGNRVQAKSSGSAAADPLVLGWAGSDRAEAHRSRRLRPDLHVRQRGHGDHHLAALLVGEREHGSTVALRLLFQRLGDGRV